MRAFITPSRLRRAVIGWAVLAGVLLAAAALVAGLGTPAIARSFTDFLLVAFLVVALQLFMGNSGIVSFGHVAFIGVGAYTAALLTIPPAIKGDALPELPPFLQGLDVALIPSVLIAMIVAALAAALVGGALARMEETAMAMATLALLVVAHTVFVNWDAVTRGTFGIYGIPKNTTLWVALGGLAGLLLAARLYRESRPGLRLQAAREDPLPARAMGVNVPVTRFSALVLSSAAMGAGGALWAQSLLAFDPDQFFFPLTFTILSMLVIGGRASVSGALAGAALVTLTSELLRNAERGFALGPLRIPQLPGLVQLSVAVLIIVVLVFRRGGVFGRWELDDLVALSWRRLFHRRASGASPSDAGQGRGGAPAGERGRGASTGEHGQGASTGERKRGAATREKGREGILRAEGVAKDFSGVHALSEVDLSVSAGEILGLIGPNGSGKTTLLNVLSGVLTPTAGRVFLDDEEISGWPPHRVARRGVSRTFQNIRLFGQLTVTENLLAGAGSEAREADVEALLARFDLVRHSEELPVNLPYGVQRRVEIARAVVRRPTALLLDEPAAGMNEAESDELLDNILKIRDELGCAVVVVDHDLRLIMQLCERIQVLNEGRMVSEGLPHEVASDPAVIEAYLGTGGGNSSRLSTRGAE